MCAQYHKLEVDEGLKWTRMRMIGDGNSNGVGQQHALHNLHLHSMYVIILIIASIVDIVLLWQHFCNVKCN